ncbi:MAG: hypothetical protein K2X93_17040 [Candidatus Obscuribacterales bacterium]|nr:hypothetical protein [Candidatus Obscuribacterales bacterium]
MRDSDTMRSFSSNRTGQVLLQRDGCDASATELKQAALCGTPSKFRIARHIGLSVFIIAYFFCVSASTLPSEKLKRKLISPVFGIISGLGLVQNWKLFCPNVRRVNFHPAATISYADGLQELWQAPRFDRMNLLEHIANDKLRRFYIDSLSWPSHKEYWVDVCRAIARRHDDAVNPVTSVMLGYRWVPIPPPSEFAQRDKLPAHNRFFNSFFYCDRSEKEQ